MKIEEGETWHTYTTDIDLSCGLENLIQPLLASEIFTACIDYEGFFYHREGIKFRKEKTILEFTQDFHGMKIKTPEIFENTELDIGLKKCIINQLYLLQSKKKAFSDPEKFPGKYITFFMDTSLIKVEGQESYDTTTICLNLYDENIAQLTYVNHSNLDGLELSYAINTSVNRNSRPIESFLAPPALAMEEINLLQENSKLARKIRDWNYYSKKKDNLFANRETHYNRQFIELIEQGNTPVTIPDLALHIVDITGNIIRKSTTSSVTRFLYPIKDGNYRKHFWSGHPSVFIFSHDNQQNTSNKNSAINDHLILCLLTRAFIPEHYHYDKSEPQPDLRLFDDYNYYHSSSVSLTLLPAQTHQILKDLPYGYMGVVSDSQVKTEAALLLKQKLTTFGEEIKSARTSHQLDQLIAARDIDEERAQFSMRRSGEIYQFFNAVRKDPDYLGLSESIQKRLSIIEKAKDRREQRSSQLKSLIIAIFFGVIASGTLLNDLIMPSLKIFSVVENDTDPQTRLTTLISTYACLITICVLVLKSPKK